MRVVYLAQASGRLGPTGALIAGNDVTLIAGENLDNVGTLKATMMGLVRVLSQPRAMGLNVLNLTQAMAMYRQWLETPAVGLLADPPGLDDTIAQLLGRRGEPQPIRLWTDMCLAATAQSAGLRMVTFDRDFERFGLTRCLVLPTDAKPHTNSDTAP